MFFQIMLLSGYAFAFALDRLSRTRELAAYTLVITAAVVCLPTGGLPSSWAPDWEHSIVFNLSMGLLLTAGIPFFAVASVSPLVQRWFSLSRHSAASDPYFLYALSNAGSLAALLGYPTIIEAYFDVEQQLTLWSIAFVLFAATMLALRLSLASNENEPAYRDAHFHDSKTVGIERRIAWILLAFVPSSLSLALTQHLSTDVAAFPLLWILPLSLYLISFIVAFSTQGRKLVRFCERCFPWCVIPPVMLLTTGFQRFILLQLALHLMAFFIIAVCLHAKLAALRPIPAKLTEYFLYLSFGGALGGIFNTLIAPALFNSILEYLIGILLACVFAWPSRSAVMVGLNRAKEMLPRLSDIAISLAAIITLLCIAPLLTYTEIDLKLAGMPISLVLELLVPALFLAGAVRNQRRFLIMSVALLFFPYLEFLNSEQHVRSQRNFFGVLQVRRQKQHDGHWTELWHGSTLHGMQYSKPPLSQVATTYFSPTSPVGRFLTSNYAASHISRAALIGLGVGTLAQYGEPNWQIDYFEIDADVVEIARDSGHFTYLAQSRAPINFIIGDARLKLQEKPRANYDTIVIDAFSSDSIPIHLITLEAAELYLDRLTSNGVIAFHVTNRHLDLAPLLAALANKLNVKAVYCADLKRTDDEISAGKFVSLWVFFLRAPLEQKELSLDDPTCSVLKDGGGFRVWTDRYSNVLAAFK